MDLRLLEISLPRDDMPSVTKLLSDVSPMGLWIESLGENLTGLRILLSVAEVEGVTDRIQDAVRDVEQLRIIVLRVEATIPKPVEPETVDKQDVPQRVSRQELYSAIYKATDFSSTYLAFVVLSTIVAAIGLMNGSTTALIGAMVIAPLLGPNVALALATTLGDSELARKAMKTNLGGITIAFLFSFVIGLMFQPGPELPEIADRAGVNLSDPLLALASGAAGVLAFTTGAPTSLVGVMVAVALLPPLAAAGLMLSGGHYDEAFGAAMLVLVNVICVNLAGVGTFLLQGIRPRRWWEVDRAERASHLALLVWFVLLVVLVAVIYLVQNDFPLPVQNPVSGN